MRRVLDVFLGETALQVGTFRFEVQCARQSAGFEYHPNWLAAEWLKGGRLSIGKFPSVQDDRSAKKGKVLVPRP